ncbi:MAG: hypothetical protein SV966_12440 [Actinomycetota bacterium]|nr:hypothetical protein [Actinomycetota bacterium]
MTTPTATPSVDPFHDFWLPDYCPECNPAGHNADRCVRLATQTEPDAVTWRGGKVVVCEYQCDRCGHAWTNSDLWDAQCAGFTPQRRAA